VVDDEKLEDGEEKIAAETVAAELPEPGLPFPVVGVGASAGGLEAFTELLEALPADTGMAFVFVTHLSATQPSQLTKILARVTSMPVVKVEGKPAVRPDTVYVIPPGRILHVEDGHLRLTRRDLADGPPRPVDDFFRTLAQHQGRRAIGVVLSGTGHDGTVGLEEIQGAGGFAFCQDESALHDGMPRSAAAAGCVDLVLPPQEIAQELVRMARHPYVGRDSLEDEERRSRRDIAQILALIESNLGVDFTAYKISTLFRRTTRRMVLHKLQNLRQYLQLLRSSPVEIEELFQDILINVTRFFRDPEAFETMKAGILPKLAADRGRDDPLRIWVLGCSTGEEAYSLAILCEEFARELGRPLPVRIFATDLNQAGIEKARAGVYPKSIESDVSPERLREFFVAADGGYRVSRAIREMCVFAPHNGLTEPPFSHMDIVSCRNMLIYLDRSLQERLLPLLHYALRADGLLWLGASEAIGSFSHLFETCDARLKMYRKRGSSAVSGLPLSVPSSVPSKFAALHPQGSPPARLSEPHRDADRILLTRFVPASVLTNSDLEILQFRGDTSAFLTPAPGRASLNLFKMVREEFTLAVRSACDNARRDGMAVRHEVVPLTGESGCDKVTIEVIPIRSGPGTEVHYLIVFSRGDAEAGAPAPTSVHASDEEAQRLRDELATTREYLRSVIEQQEAAYEELQSANEEVQSANEELQSTNEELQTSKEEIESSNEELATVNEELHNRNQELSRSNDDLVNLLTSVRTPIVMLDSDLCIRRFTPMAEKILNLRAVDVGRPIDEIKLGLSVEDLQPVVAEVIHRNFVREIDVKDRHGLWYSLRVSPYRTFENEIAGAVLLLVDIDIIKRARQYAEAIVAAVAEPLVVLDADLRVQKASHLFYQALHMSPEQTELAPFPEINGGQWNTPELRRAIDEVRYTGGRILDFEHVMVTRDGVRRTMLLNAQRLTQEDGSLSIVLTIKDITDRKNLEETLRSRVEQLAQANRRQNEFLAMLAHELRNPLAALRSGTQVLEMASGDAETAARTRAMMQRQVANMARMIDDLLDVSRITSGRIQLRLEPIDLVQVVERCCDTMRPVLEGRGQTLHYHCGAGPTLVDGDPVRLEQILGNLLNNSSKFTHDGGTVWVSLDQDEDDDKRTTAIVRVRDDGVGLAAEMVSRVFEPFMQVQRSSGSSGGLGIGLTLVRRLVELHGGTIQASSDGLGSGSLFEVRLPMRRIDTSASAPIRGDGSRRTASLRVLVVDDNVDAAESLAILLRLSGHEVRTAHDGETAIETAARFDPDAMLLDIGLPGIDGYHVAKRVRRSPDRKKTMLIALTGYGQKEDRERSAEAGFDVHLMKPVDLAQVERTLEDLMQRRDGGPGGQTET